MTGARHFRLPSVDPLTRDLPRPRIQHQTRRLTGLLLQEGHARAVAAESDMIISIITEDHGVRRIFTGSQGFLSADVKGKATSVHVLADQNEVTSEVLR